MGQKESPDRTNKSGRALPKTAAIRATPVATKKTGKLSLPVRTPSSDRNSYALQNIPFLFTFVIMAVLSCLAAPVFAGGIAYISIQESSKILPNVTTLDLPIGGKTLVEASELIHQIGNVSHDIVLTNQIVSKSVPVTDLGISLDALKTAEAAYSLGRTGDIFTRIKTIFQAYTGEVYIDPLIMVDINLAKSGLESLAPFFSQAPTEASFYLENEQIKTLPGKIGYTINLDDALVLLQGNSNYIFHSNLFAVPLQPVMPLTLDLSNFLPEAIRLVETPKELIFYDPILDQWITEKLPKPTLLDWLMISASSEGYSLQINPSKVTEYLGVVNQNLLPSRTIDITNATALVMDTIINQSHPVILIQHQPTTYTVQPGDTLLRVGWRLGFPYWQIIDANPSMDPDQLVPGTEINIPSKNVLLPLPMVLHKRVIISIEQQRLWVYEYGEQIQKFVISTGIDRSPTQPGVFQVQTHVPSAYASIWDLTMPNFLGIYEAWPGFMNGIHGLPTLSNGRILWANVLGKPASYGCIILDLDAAEWLYQWAEDGVIVEIRP